MSWDRTKSFLAKDDFGNEYQINVFIEYTEVSTRGPHGIKTERQAMRLDDETHVNRLAKGEYETVGARPVTLRSDDPNAV